jgi:hypothetical protein
VELIQIAALLLFIMLLLLAGGVWIAMTLAIVGWIGMAFFTGTPPGKNLFTACWSAPSSPRKCSRASRHGSTESPAG